MWAVKIPVYAPFNGLDSNEWNTVDEFEFQYDAIKFAKKKFGANDQGFIQLVEEQ